MTGGRDSDPTFPNLLLPATAGGTGGRERRSGPSSSSPPPGSLCQSRADGCPCQLGGHSPLQARLHLPANNPVLPATSALCPTRVPAFWQPRAGSIPAASREKRRAGPRGRGKAGWQLGGETVGVRSHKSSSRAFLFNTLFPFELSVKPLIN